MRRGGPITALVPLPDGQPQLLLARSLPGSFMVDQTRERLVHEGADYMSVGQHMRTLSQWQATPKTLGSMTSSSTTKRADPLWHDKIHRAGFLRLRA